MKKYSYLFLSLLLLVAGLGLILTGQYNYTSLCLLIIGMLGSICSVFILLPTKADKKNEEKNTKFRESAPAISSQNVRATPPPQNGEFIPPPPPSPEKMKEIIDKRVEKKLKEAKVSCKYCFSKFDAKLDRCPYCGAPASEKK